MASTVVSKPRLARPARASIPAAALLATTVVALMLLLAHHAPVLTIPPSATDWYERYLDNISTPLRHDWSPGETSERCEPIFRKLSAARMLCGRHATSGDSCEREPDWEQFKLGSVWMFSQFGQDAYLFTRHFTHMKRRGVYVDVASNDAIKLSNSFFFDRCLGWKGVCIEGNPMYYERTFTERSCLLVPTCAGETDGEQVSFVLNGERGGVADDSYKFGTNSKMANSSSTMAMRCTTLKTVLHRAGISRVDFMSLDVEGHELAVLKGIDWERVRVDVISVEVTHCFKEVEKMLKRLGYVRHFVGKDSDGSPVGKGFLGMDGIFVHADVRLGEPE